MRGKDLAILFALPMANGLSLANFQQINSILIPLSCLLTYDGQIPSCTKSDFTNGCSTACIAGLNSIAQSVSDSCAEVTVNSNTLLGIVKNGQIVAALCPILATSTSTLVRSTTTPIAASSAAPAVSVTIPTDSQGVTGGLGLKTTTSTSVLTTSSSLRSSSVVSVTIKSTSTSTTSTVSSSPSSTFTSSTSATTTSSTNDGGAASNTPAITTSSTSSSKKGSVAATTTSSTSKPATRPDDSSGGGSPFDISSSGNRIGGDSVMGLVVLVLVCIVMGR